MHATTPTAPDPGPRLERRRAELERSRVRERRLAAGGLLTFALGVALSLCSLDHLFGLDWRWMIPLAFLVQVAMVMRRERATRARRRVACAVEWNERALSRRRDEWDFGQDDGRAYSDPDHPYVSDLDVFGPRSLFERINGTETVLGRDDLAAMLRGELPGKGPRERQAAVRELRDEAGWRETFAVELRAIAEQTGDDERERERIEGDTRRLLEWGGTDTPPAPPLLHTGLHFLLGGVCTFSLLGAAALGWSWGPFALSWLLNLVVLGRAKEVEHQQPWFDRVRLTLDAWSRVLQLLEGRRFETPLLEEARARLASGGQPASRAIARLRILADRLSWRANTFWALSFDVMWVWDIHVLRGLMRWKREHGPRLESWLRGAARIESCASLAAYADAVPDAAWPRVREDGSLLEARALAHPLLPAATRVANDLQIPGTGHILLVTGSNMSGKSTFLRSVGLAAVMARVGMPVAAREITLRDASVVTCMRVHDSLSQGSSQFHAEVTRLAACVDWTRGQPLTLALLDEILAGTNSRERHLGSLALLRSLAGLPAAVLTATHDLALSEIGDELPGACEVVHFRDLVDAGRMSFDYVMRSGPLPTTNALRVMRAAGLDVPADPEDGREDAGA